MPSGENTACKGAAVLFLFFVATAPLPATPVIVPASLAAVEGNSSNGYPFNIAAFSLPSQRYQQVYSYAAFFGPLTITDIVFRPDAGFGSSFSSTLASVRIDLSTTSATVGALSATFASNVGANDTIVFNGALSSSSSFTGPSGGPKNFDILIHLTTPFFYNPANGNLLMDVRNFSGGTTTFFDTDVAVGGPTSRAFTTSSGVNSASADFLDDRQGLVTEFLSPTPAPTPEPASLALLFSSGLALAALAGRRLGFRP